MIGLGVKFAIENIPDFGGPADYVGEGTDPVEVKVEEGQTLTEIGRTLKALGVVASVDAWLEAAAKEPKAKKIGPGSVRHAQGDERGGGRGADDRSGRRG